MPALSAAIATYDLPDDGPVRAVEEISIWESASFATLRAWTGYSGNG